MLRQRNGGTNWGNHPVPEERPRLRGAHDERWQHWELLKASGCVLAAVAVVYLWQAFDELIPSSAVRIFMSFVVLLIGLITVFCWITFGWSDRLFPWKVSLSPPSFPRPLLFKINLQAALAFCCPVILSFDLSANPRAFFPQLFAKLSECYCFLLFA